MFLLDTDHIGILQSKYGEECRRLSVRMAKFEADEFYTPIVAFHEQVLGWNAYLARSRGQQGVVRAYDKFERLLRDFSSAQVASFDDAASQVFQSLRRQKIRVSTMDLRIAAIALSRNFTVLTRNTVDFGAVPGLHVEDWTVE